MAGRVERREVGATGGRPDPGATVTFAAPSGDADSSDSPRGSGDLAHAAAGGRFQVIGPHASGGLGEVFIAFDRELKRSVALKELRTRFAHDPSAQTRFLLEAEVTGSLEHPGIVPIYSLGRHQDGRPYYAMHLVQGETLRNEIDRFHTKSEAIDEPEDRALAFRRLLRSLIDACNAVAYAHSRGVIHRDLKPENIMLGRFGETLVVDWGLAKRLVDHDGQRTEISSPASGSADASMTQPGSLIGTPRYMSPEQAAGLVDELAPASDVYSLGAILYCILVGDDPFADGDVADVLARVARGIFPAPRRLRRSIDAALEGICLKAMAIDPIDRYATALELANELETWLADVRYRREHAFALNQVKATLARLCLERAHMSFDKDTHSEGMLWLARALENAAPGPVDLERVVRTSLSGWHVGTKLLERGLRHGCAVRSLAFCPESRRLATAGEDRVARLWDLATGSVLATPMQHDGPVHEVAFSPAGTLVATVADDRKIRLWDAWTGAPRGKHIAIGGPTALAFSPDGSLIAAASDAGAPFVWNCTSFEPAHRPYAGRAAVLAIAFTHDGKTLAIAVENGDVCLHETSSGRPIGEPLGHPSAVSILEFHANGQSLLTGSSQGEVRLWDVGRGVPLMTLAHDHPIRSLSFRPDGAAFATLDDDGVARLWETATGRPIGEPLGRGVRVDCLAFRPDAMMIATGCPDGTVRLWCAATALPIGPPLVQGGAVRTLAFSPDGRRLASGGTDTTVRCWKLPSPLEGTAERVSCWVGVTTELEFDSGDAVRRIDGTKSWELRRRLGELGGALLR